MKVIWHITFTAALRISHLLHFHKVICNLIINSQLPGHNDKRQITAVFAATGIFTTPNNLCWQN